jgi:hypothetical protein
MRMIARSSARVTMSSDMLRSANRLPMVMPRLLTMLCSICSDGRALSFSIFDNRLSEQPTASASCLRRSPFAFRAWRSRFPTCNSGDGLAPFVA